MEITFDTKISDRQADIFLNKSESINRLLTAASEDTANGFVVNEISKAVYEIVEGKGLDLPLTEPGKTLTFAHLQLTDTNFQNVAKNAIRFHLQTASGVALLTASQLTLLNMDHMEAGLKVVLPTNAIAPPEPGQKSPKYNLLVMLGYKPAAVAPLPVDPDDPFAGVS
jgi:hypothetical protein